MNKVQQGIYEKVVAPAMSQIAGMVIGELRSFNARLQIGTVRYTTASDQVATIKKGVPFALSKGIKQAAPFPGDPVLLGFLNNSYQQPIILAILDKEYMLQTRNEETIHKRNGAGVSDFYSARMGEQWI